MEPFTVVPETGGLVAFEGEFSLMVGTWLDAELVTGEMVAAGTSVLRLAASAAVVARCITSAAIAVVGKPLTGSVILSSSSALVSIPCCVVASLSLTISSLAFPEVLSVLDPTAGSGVLLVLADDSEGRTVGMLTVDVYVLSSSSLGTTEVLDGRACGALVSLPGVAVDEERLSVLPDLDPSVAPTGIVVADSNGSVDEDTSCRSFAVGTADMLDGRGCEVVVSFPGVSVDEVRLSESVDFDPSLLATAIVVADSNGSVDEGISDGSFTVAVDTVRVATGFQLASETCLSGPGRAVTRLSSFDSSKFKLSTFFRLSSGTRRESSASVVPDGTVDVAVLAALATEDLSSTVVAIDFTGEGGVAVVTATIKE